MTWFRICFDTYMSGCKKNSIGRAPTMFTNFSGWESGHLTGMVAFSSQNAAQSENRQKFDSDPTWFNHFQPWKKSDLPYRNLKITYFC